MCEGKDPAKTFARKASSLAPAETDGGDTSTNDDDEKTAKGGVSSKAKETKMEMPDSDPKGVVLARVRYLLENENIDEKENHCNSVLPPYHIFNANSECIAVWVKTGRFSTLQAAIFLHSTALGQVKSAATLSLFVASQTVPVTTTVSAGGVLGWFGMTTTSTALVSADIAVFFFGWLEDLLCAEFLTVFRCMYDV